jgi:alpha-galactosidase
MTMMKEQRLTLGDMQMTWTVTEDGQVSSLLIPSAMASALEIPRSCVADCEDAPYVPWKDIPLREPHCVVQVCRAGDAMQDNCGGLTLQWSSTTKALRFRDLEIDERQDRTSACLCLETDDGLRVKQMLDYRAQEDAFRLWTEVENLADHSQAIDHVSAALLSGISPFATDDAPGDLVLHRFRSGWSSEARHLEQPLESLELERAWTPHGMRVERFGQAGSKPSQLWMPWVGIEHRSQGVVWALHYEAVASWQAEVLRRDDAVSISIGEGDRLFANCQVSLAPGETLSTPAAWVTACAGDVQDACARLVSSQRPQRPAPEEKDLPIVFNEWCTTWGEPSHDNMVAIAERLQGTPCRYQVIDSGWFRPESGGMWSTSQGDWIPNAELFPQGLRATCEAIRERGLIPGLWFEFEVVGVEARVFNQAQRFLHRDGLPIRDGARRLLDLRQEENCRYLRERMFNLIRDCGIGYIKVDYNCNIGSDVDGPHSPGANLAEHMQQVVGIFKELKESFPNLVIENCASGGQRLTPAYGAISDMHSFSDAHTCPDIPVIAANVLSVIPAAQSQIWAVLNADASLQRLSYSLAATFLGRMCLSGDIHHLGEDAWRFVREGMAFYRKVWPVIKDGRSRRVGEWCANMRRLRGWQAVVRRATSGETLVVVHCFGNPPDTLAIPIPSGLEVMETFGHAIPECRIEGGQLQFRAVKEWTGWVVCLEERTG